MVLIWQHQGLKHANLFVLKEDFLDYNRLRKDIHSHFSTARSIH